jgi:hypothetical protein
MGQTTWRPGFVQAQTLRFRYKKGIPTKAISRNEGYLHGELYGLANRPRGKVQFRFNFPEDGTRRTTAL